MTTLAEIKSRLYACDENTTYHPVDAENDVAFLLGKVEEMEAKHDMLRYRLTNLEAHCQGSLGYGGGYLETLEGLDKFTREEVINGKKGTSALETLTAGNGKE